jgi:hypothetical protein
VHRQTNRHSGGINEIVPAHMRVREVQTFKYTSMHVGLLAFLSIPDSWLPNSESLLLLIQSYIPTCVLVCVYNIYLIFFFGVYLAAGFLTLCFSSIQAALFEQQPVVGPSTRRFCRAFLTFVSVRVSCGCCLCVCLCVFVSRCAPADKQTQ